MNRFLFYRGFIGFSPIAAQFDIAANEQKNRNERLPFMLDFLACRIVASLAFSFLPFLQQTLSYRSMHVAYTKTLQNKSQPASFSANSNEIQKTETTKTHRLNCDNFIRL